jgi:hypothetical protein
MSEAEVYPAFPKIARLNRGIVITEKIDGTNALVHVANDGTIRAGCRTRWITPEADNFGFAAWVRDNAAELSKLGPGHHYGEWWGAGIQRRYGLDHKRFSLFNTGRWKHGADDVPSCCYVVPLLYAGVMSGDCINEALESLRKQGSFAAPGFMNPEGVVVFHAAASKLFKVTLDNDGAPKGQPA